MLVARWLPATTISQSYAVHEAALFRYSQRGMLGARWDAASAAWLYDMLRVRELFVHRDARVPLPPEGQLGTLGETRLAGAGLTRRSDARGSRQPLRVLDPSAPLDEPRRITRAS